MLNQGKPSTISTIRAVDPNSVDSVDDLGKAKILFRRLIRLGVVLSMTDDGRLVYDAPASVLDADLLETIRFHRDQLLELVERFEERAAIAQYDGGLSRGDAERLALDCVAG